MNHKLFGIGGSHAIDCTMNNQETTTNDSSSTPMSDTTRARLNSVGRRLLRLHKSLLDVERADYETLYGRVSPGQLLQMLIQDDWFAWLRVISELVVQVDEMVESKTPIAEQEAHDLLQQVATALQPTEEGDGFSGKFYRALQHNNDAVLLYAEVGKLLSPAS